MFGVSSYCPVQPLNGFLRCRKKIKLPLECEHGKTSHDQYANSSRTWRGKERWILLTGSSMLATMPTRPSSMECLGGDRVQPCYAQSHQLDCYVPAWPEVMRMGRSIKERVNLEHLHPRSQTKPLSCLSQPSAPSAPPATPLSSDGAFSRHS